MNCIKIVKGLSLVLLMGVLPLAQALEAIPGCKYRWILACEDCTEPMLVLSCSTNETCQVPADGAEKCPAEQNVKGHIKSNTMVDIVISFRVINDNAESEKVRWHVKNVELSATYFEKHFLESLIDTVLAETSATRIIDWDIYYHLGIDTEFAIVMDWQDALARLSNSTPIWNQAGRAGNLYIDADTIYRIND